MKKSSDLRFSSLMLIPAVIFCGFFLLQGIKWPYVGYNAWNFNTYSLIAHNYLKFGLFETGLRPIISVTSSFPENPIIYLHHPQLLSILQYVAFVLLGESYVSGRIPVIVATLMTIPILYLIAKKIFNDKTAFFVALIYCLLPATTVFGRMIGQEAILLFIVSLSLYLILLYISSKRRSIFCFLIFTIIFGVFTDWPMVYFVFSLVPWLLYIKEKKTALIICTTAVLSALVFLGYVYVVVGNFDDLLNAFFVRSLGELLSQQLWQVRWFLAILIRYFIYFTPLLAFLSFFYLAKTLESTKKLDDKQILVGCLLLFGIVHILFYPEGSFGHAYWIIYLTLFVVFSSATVMAAMWKKSRYLVLLLLFFTILWTILVQHWKTNEIRVNLFRAELGKQVDTFATNYETVSINQNGAIDPDIYQYQLRQNVHYMSADQALNNTDQRRLYIYSCMVKCNLSELKDLIRTYEYVLVSNIQAEAYIFFLNRPSRIVESHLDGGITVHRIKEEKVEKKSLFKTIYQEVKSFLNVAQI